MTATTKATKLRQLIERHGMFGFTRHFVGKPKQVWVYNNSWQRVYVFQTHAKFYSYCRAVDFYLNIRRRAEVARMEAYLDSLNKAREDRIIADRVRELVKLAA